MQKAIDEFFNPDYEEDLHDPFLMLGMEKAVKRILKAIKNQEETVIFGDYDADGVCGAAILQKTLKMLGANLLDTYIPNRAIEGYGFNFNAVRELASRGAKLIISTDCGVTDFEEIKLANSLKMEVIITDHHEIINRLPEALAVVNPYQKKDKYPFKDLAAAGVAFKLVQALILKSKQKIAPGWEKWLLDLVAIATVAESVSLLGENRTLVKYGLFVLAQTNKIGLQELMKIARLSPVLNQDNLSTNLDSRTLGFVLGPRLNAASRMDHANTAYRLLITEDRQEADNLAKDLEQKNRDRQVLTEKVMNQVQERLKQKEVMPALIFEGSSDWPIGILGLVAGRLTDQYFRPAIIFNENEKFCKASARSIPKFNLTDVMKNSMKFLMEFGGHPMSAGFSFKKENADALKKSFEDLAIKLIMAEDSIPEIQVDSQINAADINFELFDEIQKFEPFGEDNENVSFLLKNLTVWDIKNVGGSGQHIKFELESGDIKNKKLKAIGFNLTSKNGHIKIGDKIDIIFNFIINEWNGNKELQFKIIDIKKLCPVRQPRL